MTSKELDFLKDTLNQEQQAIKKCQTYAEHSNDQSIKSLFAQAAQRHETHYKKILTQLNV
ncbi:MAG TPA: hypothetical protein DEP72_08330 [Clostridiales bacterium]|nr:MAG: hypothetical protein A2Y18_03330 [Clostridiales bacterium GWD2_32_19]HCC08144.1 hypothetical protein [Clostridiales bacterium]